MLRRLEYVAGGRMRDAETRNLISAQTVVREYNAMAERLEAEDVEVRRRRDNVTPHRTP